MLISRLLIALMAAVWLVGAPAPSQAACTTDPECNDGNDCTIDSCDVGLSHCVNTPSSVCGAVVDLPVFGRKIKLRIPLKRPERRGIRILLKRALTFDNLPPPESGSDPVLTGGSIRVFSSQGDVFDTTYRLPKEHWNYFPLFNPTEFRGYQYKDAFNVEGPFGVVKIIAEKTAKIKAKANVGLPLDFSLDTNPRPVDVVLTLGVTRYCMRFEGDRWQYKDGKIFWAKNALAPASCPCVASSDCSDGDPGNGVEQCVSGLCQ